MKKEHPPCLFREKHQTRWHVSSFCWAISVRSDNRHMGIRSTTYRVINAILWLYLCLSDVMHPVITTGDFWSEKFQQVFHLNRNFGDPARLLVNAMIPVVLWFAITHG